MHQTHCSHSGCEATRRLLFFPEPVCHQHETPEQVALINDLDKRASGVGLTGSPVHWPQITSIDIVARNAMVEWAERLGLRASNGRRCLDWLRKGKCAKKVCESNSTVSGWRDHASIWNRNGKPALFLAQPYGHDDPQTQQRLRETLEADGELKVVINGQGWYGHNTVAIEVWRRDAYLAHSS